MLLPRLIFALAAVAGSALADRWELQYFHDRDDSTLVLTGIGFFTPQRGIATGVQYQNGRARPQVLVTTNGGETWSPVPVKEPGLSLFLVDDSAAWMVTPGGLWFSDEGGRTWRKRLSDKDLEQVWFVSRERGWAIGRRKKVLETRDAGRTWTPVAAVASAAGNPDHTTFTAIAFATPGTGIIAGRSRPPRRTGRLPLWMDPDPERRREVPHLTLLLETRNSGETWQAQTTSVFGRISRLALDRSGRGLALFEFDNYFRLASEIVRLDMRTGGSTPALRSRDRAITDLALLPGGSAVAVGVETAGGSLRSPLPRKVKVLASRDLASWTEASVDYRAVATRVMLALLDEDHAWAATDTGMILRFKRE